MPNASRLFVRRLDEVSSVDRGAGADALIAIAKRDTGRDPDVDPIFDEAGNEIDPAQLENGDVVYGEDGTAFQYLDEAAAAGALDGDDPAGDHGFSDDDLDLLESEFGVTEDQLEGLSEDQLDEIDAILTEAADTESEPERELVGAVGKRGAPGVTGGLRSLQRTGRGMADRALGQGGRGLGPSQGAHRGRSTVGTRRGLIAAGGAGAAGAGMVSHARSSNRSLSKSFGQSVLDTLSKSMSDAQRDEVISKALDMAAGQTARANRRADQAFRIAKAMQDERELEQYESLAGDYGLPVNQQEFGGILREVSSVLSKRQLDTLDQVLQVAGNADMFSELGHSGNGRPSDVMDTVVGAATEVITKSDNGATREQAVTAMFAANPDLYDQYEREQSGY